MNLVERTKKQAKTFLADGEVVQAAFVANYPKHSEVWVISTNRRILVFESSTFRRKLTKIVGSLPRSTKFGGLTHQIPPRRPIRCLN